MTNDPIKPSVLAVKLIPNVDDKMAEEFKLPKGYKSIGIVTADC
ncbi:MAG: ethanolamine utilization microcompartment protein EutL, partial [Cetobacterium sp.]